MISIKDLEQGFESADLRVKFEETVSQSRSGLRLRPVRQPVFTIDVRNDKQGEYFEIRYSPDAEPWEIIDRDKKHRHVLLMERATRTKMLVGHDETHLFVSNVSPNSKDIEDALVRLAPAGLRDPMRNQKKARRNLWKRSTPRYIRQGEWFFIPEPGFMPDEGLILRNEPLQRNTQSKPHICEEMYRTGGDTVYLVHHKKNLHAIEMTPEKWAEVSGNPEYRLVRTAVRDASVFVRGAIRHPDHKTIHLKDWHSVQINGELILGSRSGFLD